ncbi:RNA polymerase sigma factor [Maribacter hydrothermalis]|uniref:RNA polymerase sigma-70 region 2 domain-containing protein n=1 Tax=Maribacter hydrothermalis TaxID=1836467 RepID=A0A1B7Z627_9FLAO|nr:sigma-70 family RNA polymerase sigma factor [Maribacter hydrothermalis]APQ16721.1 hypothetical protein BTR34_05025 [Maribacter hydrothermalis]OBR38182.1 hypothetical protein A9200_18030 [Maribacter hydrothermalis]
MHKKDTLTKNYSEQEELIKAIHNNNELLLKKLYQDNYYKTEKYILQNSGTLAEAKDIYQEAFIAVWENVQDNKFSPKNSTALNGYIYTIAKNKWLDQLKSTYFKKTHKLDKYDHKLKSEPDTEFEENELEQDSKINKVVVQFKAIGKECQQLLTVFYYDNKPLKEIAAKLKLTEASTRNKKYRCLEKLRALVLKSN